jgi:hypothetical protein
MLKNSLSTLGTLLTLYKAWKNPAHIELLSGSCRYPVKQGEG